MRCYTRPGSTLLLKERAQQTVARARNGAARYQELATSKTVLSLICNLLADVALVISNREPAGTGVGFPQWQVRGWARV